VPSASSPLLARGMRPSGNDQIDLVGESAIRRTSPMPPVPRGGEPHVCPLIVLGNATAAHVQGAEGELAEYEALICGLAVPHCRLCRILGHTLAPIVHAAEDDLR